MSVIEDADHGSEQDHHVAAVRPDPEQTSERKTEYLLYWIQLLDHVQASVYEALRMEIKMKLSVYDIWERRKELQGPQLDPRLLGCNPV